MAATLEKRLNTLASDIHAIQKDLFLSRIGQSHRTRRAITSWAALTQKISGSWDSVSACDEISAQREKQW